LREIFFISFFESKKNTTFASAFKIHLLL